LARNGYFERAPHLLDQAHVIAIAPPAARWRMPDHITNQENVK
jgi:hypothetical protein